jgi:hypothetical protein
MSETKTFEVKNLVAVSGIAGIQKLISVRGDGLIVEDFDTKQRRFAPTRQHQFSPLETISIYTQTDAESIADVFYKMSALGEEVPSEKESSNVLRAYMFRAMPEHDADRVHISDIKKLVKWFAFLQKRNLLVEKSETASSEKTEDKIENKVEDKTEGKTEDKIKGKGKTKA